jgi:hypothetical protein
MVDFLLTANAPHPCQTAHQGHQDHPDQLVNQDNQAPQAALETMVVQAKPLRHVPHRIHLAKVVQPDLLDHLDPMDRLDHLDPMDNPELPVKVVAKGHLDHPGQPVMLGQMDSQEAPDNQGPQAKMLHGRRQVLVQKAHQVAQDPLDHPDQMDNPANPEDKDHQDPLEILANQVLREAMDNQGNLEVPVCQDPMPHTALAHLAPACLCTVNKQLPSLVYLLLFFAKKKQTED